MKKLLLLLLVLFLAACGSKAPDKDLINEEVSNKDLLQTIKNSYLYSTKDLSSLYGYKMHKHRKEVSETLKIADTFRIAGYNQTKVLYSFSIGSNIFRESNNYKKEDGKWYRTFLYTSTYKNTDPFKDGNGEKAEQILEKETKWNEESEEVEKQFFGT